MGERNAALNTAPAEAHDERTVTLTREQWERVAMMLWFYGGRMRDDARQFANSKAARESMECAELARGLNRAICDQAGLPEVFRCE